MALSENECDAPDLMFFQMDEDNRRLYLRRKSNKRRRRRLFSVCVVWCGQFSWADYLLELYII